MALTDPQTGHVLSEQAWTRRVPSVLFQTSSCSFIVTDPLAYSTPTPAFLLIRLCRHTLAAFQVAMVPQSASKQLISAGYWSSVTILLVLAYMIAPVTWIILLTLGFALK